MMLAICPPTGENSGVLNTGRVPYPAQVGTHLPALVKRQLWIHSRTLG